MAATATVKISVEIAGLGSETELTRRFVHSVAPAEVFKGYTVIGTTATDLDLGGIDEQAVLGVLITAKGTVDTDRIGILIDSTGDPVVTAGNMVLNAGSSVYINFEGSTTATPGLGDGNAIRLIGAASTSAVEYIVFGK